jgi:trans-AT polyketide synthase/acyltransferase/oxidoreductase domain-containing protein
MEDVAIQLTRVSSRITNLDQKIEEIQLILQQLDKPISIVKTDDQIRFSTDLQSSDYKKNIATPVYLPDFLGDEAFKSTYGTRYALYAGSMANGISSEDLVIAMGRAGMMGSFGAGGLLPDRIETIYI